MLPILVEQIDIFISDETTLNYLLFIIFTNCSDIPAFEVLLNTNIFSKLSEILEKKNDEKNHLYAIKIIGNILSGHDIQIQRMLDLGVLNIIYNYLFTSNYKILKEVIWCISNIAAGALNHIDKLHEYGIFKILMKYINDLTPIMNTQNIIKLVYCFNIDSKGVLLCFNNCA
jgi:hypothetical protein